MPAKMTAPAPGPRYLSIWVHEFLADEAYATLSNDQLGAVFRLMLSQWAGRGTLPADHEKLARLARVSPIEMEHLLAAWPKLTPGPDLRPPAPPDRCGIRYVYERYREADAICRARSRGGQTRSRQKTETRSSSGPARTPGRTPRSSVDQDVDNIPAADPEIGELLVDRSSNGKSSKPAPAAGPLGLLVAQPQVKEQRLIKTKTEKLLSATADVDDVIRQWNETATALGLPRCRGSAAIRGRIATRLRDRDWLADFGDALRHLAAPRSDHWRGKNDTGWKADLDYLLRAGKAEQLAGWYRVNAAPPQIQKVDLWETAFTDPPHPDWVLFRGNVKAVLLAPLWEKWFAPLRYAGLDRPHQISFGAPNQVFANWIATDPTIVSAVRDQLRADDIQRFQLILPDKRQFACIER